MGVGGNCQGMCVGSGCKRMVGSRKESYCSMGIEFILQDKILESWCIAMLILLYIDFK